MSQRRVCVHGHFYQPPRENAWLEAIEQQESAYPYHDWNERITAECYGPNAHARILDDDDHIVRIVNNYASISFNFGPTLLAWMERGAPDEYGRILDADRLSVDRFGHGSAIAQAYNHLIMPLANARDRTTQTVWGLRDFEHRFGRPADGMWLPETAVDTETLETLAEHGVRFSILAPRQAAAARRIGETEWSDVSNGRIDPLRPYACNLPSGRTINLFFYDGPASQAVAFERLLENGERFARRLTGLFRDTGEPQIANIATDGETYGHHHRHGDMALAWALDRIDRTSAGLTNYAAWLEAQPPMHEVRIVENSSWSCVHGVERWRSDCGCHTGGQPGWTQAWRAPLRAALDALRDRIAPLFESAAAQLVRDPWAARDDYITLVLDRSDSAREAFLDRHAARTLEPPEEVRLLQILEMQRHAMLMYTSCGWFFNDVAGIETVQILQYAGRAAQLADTLFGAGAEERLRGDLAAAASNDRDEADAGRIYDTQVLPRRVDLVQVVAHRAVSSLFKGGSLDGPVYCYDVASLEHESRSVDGTQLVVGRARVTSRITRESETLEYAVLHFGSHHVSGGLRRDDGAAMHAHRSVALFDAFRAGDLTAVIGLLADFPDAPLSLKSLFADRQREILDRLLDARVEGAGLAYRQVYDANVDLMRILIALDLPLPRAFTMAAEFVLNRDLRVALDPASPDFQRIRTLLESVHALGTPLDKGGLALEAERAVAAMVERLRAMPADTERLAALAELTALVRTLPFEVDLWTAQNSFYHLVVDALPAMLAAVGTGDDEAVRWVRLFRAVGDQLAVAVP